MKKILLVFFLAVLLWAAITSIAYRFVNPSKTETEAFLHIPKSMMLNF